MVRKILKGSSLFCILLGVGAIMHFTELDTILEGTWAKANLTETGTQGILLYLGIVAVASACGVPRQVLAMLGGYAFGALWGTVWISLGLVLGCASGFFFARFFARDFVQKRFSKKLRHVEGFLAQKPLAAAMAIRCFPAGNNAITNLAGGVTTIPWFSFVLGSGIGYLPQSIVFCLLGSGIEVDMLWRSLVSALLFILSSLFGIYLFRQYRHQLKEAEHEEN